MTLLDTAIRGTSGYLDALAGAPQYASHLAPVWARSPDRGTFWTTTEALRQDVADRYPGSDVRLLGAGPLPRPVVVASFADYARARRRKAPAIAAMEHGTGQSYAGDARWARHPSYAGGKGWDRVSLRLAPNAAAAERWREAYPEVPVEVVGATRALPAPGGNNSRGPLLVVSFHWPGPIPELQTALPWYRSTLPLLASLPAALHAHPRYAPSVRAAAARAGLPFIESLEEVAERATVYAVDNSSTLWELGRTRPAISLNAPPYRRSVRHGLRFWDHALAPVDTGPELVALATRYLDGGESPEEAATRARIVLDVIPGTSGAATASWHLSNWLGLLGYTSDRERAATSVLEGVPPEEAR